MKHAGSVHFSRANVNVIIFLSIMLSLISVGVSLTPPRILFGGWTPILPGHPFYFGPVRRRYNEESDYQNQIQYTENFPHAVQHFHSPNANYENDHIGKEYVLSDSHKQYVPSRGNYDSPRCRPSHEPLHYESPHEPVNYEVSPGPSHYEAPREPSHEPSHYEAPLEPSHYEEAPRDPSHYEAPRDPSHYEAPRDPSHYEAPHESSHFETPREPSHYESHDERLHHEHPRNTPSHKPRFKHSKDIFAYYPPQSIYDQPPQNENLDYKPVYIENPRKPFEIYEDPHQNIPYILPTVKEMSIKDLNLNDFSSIQHGNGKKSFKITSLGQIDPRAVKYLGEINIDKVKVIPNSFNKEGYHLSQITSGKDNIPSNDALLRVPLLHGKKRIPNFESNYNLANLDIKSGKGHLTYKLEQPYIVHKHMNNFRGTPFPPAHSDIVANNHENTYSDQKPRLLNYPSPQELKSLQHSTSTNLLNQNGYKSQKFVSFPTPSLDLYTPNHELFSDVQYLTQSIPSKGTKTNFFSPKNIGKSLANQMKNYLGPKGKPYGSIQSFYSLGTPKPLLFPGKLPFNMPLAPLRNSLKTFGGSLMPSLLRNHLNKNVKLGGIYRDPSVITNIGGTPAIVDREVAIIHVPVSNQPKYLNSMKGYPNNENILFLASTPESTEIRNFKGFNKSGHYMSTEPNQGQFVTNKTYSDNLQETDIKSETNSYSNVNEAITQNQFIFVGTQGINNQVRQNIPGEENQKQFFHAYYAPANHVPPKGYVKMTKEEFNKLFKHAEIRYLDKEPIDILQYPNDGNRENTNP